MILYSFYVKLEDQLMLQVLVAITGENNPSIPIMQHNIFFCQILSP